MMPHLSESIRSFKMAKTNSNNCFPLCSNHANFCSVHNLHQRQQQNAAKVCMLGVRSGTGVRVVVVGWVWDQDRQDLCIFVVFPILKIWIFSDFSMRWRQRQ